jgi:hypothetical protein
VDGCPSRQARDEGDKNVVRCPGEVFQKAVPMAVPTAQDKLSPLSTIVLVLFGRRWMNKKGLDLGSGPWAMRCSQAQPKGEVYLKRPRSARATRT